MGAEHGPWEWQSLSAAQAVAHLPPLQSPATLPVEHATPSATAVWIGFALVHEVVSQALDGVRTLVGFGYANGLASDAHDLEAIARSLAGALNVVEERVRLQSLSFPHVPTVQAVLAVRVGVAREGSARVATSHCGDPARCEATAPKREEQRARKPEQPKRVDGRSAPPEGTRVVLMFIEVSPDTPRKGDHQTVKGKALAVLLSSR